MMDRRSMIVGMGVVVLSAQAGQAQSGAPFLASFEQAAKGLNGQNPALYYKAAFEAFKAGRKDEAVMLFYLGQLRYRTHLSARPNLPQDGDPALFGSLSVVVGQPLNEYAFGDMKALNTMLLAVMAHDRANPDAFTPPKDFPAAHRAQRSEMERFRKQVVADAGNIRAERKKNGLENRSPSAVVR